MTWLAGIVVVAFGLAFIAFTGVVFTKPRVAERFLLSFASSARAHYVEMALRLLLGISLLVLSPAMRPPTLFRVIGWAIVISSVGLLLMPWQWHNRFGEMIRPQLLRLVKVYALGAFGFGCLLLYGILWPPPAP
jgi:hypothetical protein